MTYEPEGRTVSAAPQLHAVESDDAELVLDARDHRPLIPEGEYKAVYVRHEVAEVRRFDKQPKLFLRLRLVDPPHVGLELYRSYRITKIVGKSRFVMRRESDLAHMLSKVLGIHRRPDQISLKSLKGRVLLVRVGSVKTGTRGWPPKRVELPEWQHYSVVRDILRAET
jgi:hypothetical protein